MALICKFLQNIGHFVEYIIIPHPRTQIKWTGIIFPIYMRKVYVVSPKTHRPFKKENINITLVLRSKRSKPVKSERES